MDKHKPDADKTDLLDGIADLEFDPAGLAHALNLLMRAIGRTQANAGTLLDEFTAMHAQYLAQSQELARASQAHVQAMQEFSMLSRSIYRRSGAMAEAQSAQKRDAESHPASSASIH